MSGSIISGQLISRTGRYKRFPVIGAALMVVGMLLMHFIGATTPFWETGIYMVIFGVGLGFVMQPITLAVQNAMSPRDIGVATSSATFFRQMGGTLGVAVFLSVLFSTVAGRITTALQEAGRTPAFRHALNDPTVLANPTNRAIAQSLRSGTHVGGSWINDTSFIQRLDPVLAKPFQVGFSNAMDLVFLIGAGVIAIGFVLLLFLPELPLRTQSAMAAAREPSSPTGEVPPVDVTMKGDEDADRLVQPVTKDG
jgi:MFS family permease